MILKSSYLGIDIEVSDGKIESGGEELTIISHDTLEDVILNSEPARGKNITVHYNPVITEAGHYAFMCSISDTDGRRIEKLGESTESTLTTDIAKNYPATMAFKRSFDAAAIKYLGLPSKVYSDLQIESEGERSEKTGRSYGAPPVETDGKPKKTQQPPAAKPPEEPPAASGGDIPGDTRGPKSAETGKATGAAGAEKPAKNAKKSRYAAPPLDPEEDFVDDQASGQSGGQEAASSSAPGEKKAASYTAPPIEQEVSQGSGGEDEPDEFDTTIIKCGQLSRQNLTIRAAYALNPGSIRWVAEEMVADTEFKKAQQDACRRFLAAQSDASGVGKEGR